MNTRLEIFTLGGVRIQRAGEPMAGLITKKAEALLIYLTSTGLPIEHVEYIRWPDTDATGATPEESRAGRRRVRRDGRWRTLGSRRGYARP